MMLTALCLAFPLALSGPQADGLDARPAGVPLPALPGIEAVDPPVAPPAGELARDGALAERFTAAGQRTSYAFDSRAGEISLFELAATGNARGWQAAATLRVLDQQGHELVSASDSGAVQFRVLLPFEAPSEGRYTLEVVPTQEYFRYQIVRHSSYVSHSVLGVPDIGDRGRVHTWLAAQPASIRFRVPVHAGEELVVRVEGTREEARAERRTLREVELGGVEESMMGGGRMRGPAVMERGAKAAIFGGARLVVDAAPGLVQRGATLARLVPERDGWLDLALIAEGDRAALVDLVIERAPAQVEVSGALIDNDDEGVPRVALEFLGEPDLDVWCSTTTGADGAWSARLSVGDWRVRIRRGDAAPVVLRLGVKGPASDLALLLP